MQSVKKIVLKNKTSLSLNDRFTFLRQQNEGSTSGLTGMVGGASRIQVLREARSQLQRASAKNRRLALQMENRPAVAAALRIKKRNMRALVGMGQQQQQQLMRGTVKERLTLPTRARLGWRGRGQGGPRGAMRALAAMRGGGMRSAGIMRGGGMRSLGGGMRSTLIMARNRGGRPQMIQQVPGGNAFRNRGQARNRGQMRGGFYAPRGGRGNMNNFNNNRPFIRRGVRGGNFRQPQQQRGGRGQMRGQQRGQRGRGQQRGGRRGRGGNKRTPVPTRDELDNQLDAYMAGTRSQLDKDLDQYMAVAE